MKQVDACMDRAFQEKNQNNTKWRAFIHEERNGLKYLLLIHYQHAILIYDLTAQQIHYSFWECPTDKRGLNAAIEYLRTKSYQVKVEELINYAELED
jgi:hypothetical protein